MSNSSSIAVWLTVAGLLSDLVGFFLAWREYLGASRASEVEGLQAKRLEEELARGVDTFSHEQTIHRTEVSGGRVVRTTTERIPIQKTGEEIIREEREMLRRHADARANHLGGLPAQLLARRLMFEIGALFVVIGSICQLAGALPIWN